jgi:dipeptidyl aminopeptidase/acylaminoacyl peptidase
MGMHARFLATLLLCFSAPLVAQAPLTLPGQIPASYFAKPPTYEAVRVSPDGRYLAVTARVGAEYSLLVLSLPDKKLVSGMRFASPSTVGEVEWTSRERLIIAMGYLGPGQETASLSGELFAMNADGSGKDYLFGIQGERVIGSRLSGGAQAEHGFAELEDPLPEDGDHALVTIVNSTQRTADGRYYSRTFTPLYRMNVYTGKRTQVATPPMRTPQRYFADAKGQVRMVSGVGDDSYLSKTYWRSGEGTWQLVPVQGDTLKALRITRDGRRAYFLAARGGNQQCLVEWEFPAVDAKTEPKDLLCRPAVELGTVYFTYEGRPYGYAAGTAAAMILIDQAPLEARVTASLQEQFPDQIVYLADSSHDHRKLLFFVYSDRNSGEYYLYDAVSGEASFFDATQNWIDPELMASVRRVQYKARDGLDIHGYLTLPIGREAKNLPMVVLPHGGPIGVRDTWGWEAEPQFLASRGYAVLQMNYRGSSGYGKAFEDAGYGQWGGKIIDDITDGTRWAIAQGIADAKRVCIFGASYGGYAAVMSAVREPDLYRCAVGFSGAYDLNLLVKDSDVSGRSSSKLFWEDSMAKTPEERAKQSPISYVQNLKIPLLIVHGERDIRAPFSQAKALRKALDGAGKPYEWLSEAEEGHGFANEEAMTRFYEKLEAFLGKSIGLAR